MAMRTDPGMIRSHNEDAIFADPGLGVAILADGMGGYNAGEVASGLATTRLAEDIAGVINSPAVLKRGICDSATIDSHIINEVKAANLAIFNAAQGCSQYSGMGTTLVLAWFYDNRMSVAHVGDSRLYRLRGARLEQLTRDHSLLQEQLDSGIITAEQARYAENRNLVTRALGVDPDVEVEVRDFDVRPGDIVMLCSDGLNDMVDDEDIAVTLQTLSSNLALAADHLIHLTNANGGRDNVSVILVKVLGDFSSPRGWWQRLLARLQ
ncbi:MAG: Stp1/IreP family PP2C-type Ser/Thr phosphatase [Dechloromonas sp.]|nr:Stp1/IreP family PP2C-type Ser/Thr phosphatase [Dechloromonas sp.]